MCLWMNRTCQDINATLNESIQSNEYSMDISDIVHELAVEASQHIDID